MIAVNIYGLSEVIGPGVSCETADRDGLVIMEDHFLPEIVDAETGEPLPDGEVGVLVLTSLTKQAFPVLRYWTGDLCSLTREPAPCGRTHARMSFVVGRADDMLVIRGVNVYPSQVEHTLLAVDGVSPHFQLVVNRDGTLDTLHINIERDDAAPSRSDDELLGVIVHGMRSSLGLGVTATIVAAGSLPRSEGASSAAPSTTAVVGNVPTDHPEHERHGDIDGRGTRCTHWHGRRRAAGPGPTSTTSRRSSTTAAWSNRVTTCPTSTATRCSASSSSTPTPS